MTYTIVTTHGKFVVEAGTWRLNNRFIEFVTTGDVVATFNQDHVVWWYENKCDIRQDLARAGLIAEDTMAKSIGEQIERGVKAPW